MCPQERLVIISKQTGLSFVLKRIGPVAAIVTLALYLLVLYSSVTSKPPEYLSVSIYSETFIETACQHLLLLVGIDILTYRRYYDTPPILVGHQCSLPSYLTGARTHGLHANRLYPGLKVGPRPLGDPMLLELVHHVIPPTPSHGFRVLHV